MDIHGYEYLCTKIFFSTCLRWVNCLAHLNGLTSGWTDIICHSEVLTPCLMWLVLHRLCTEHKLPTGFFAVLTGSSIYGPCNHHVNGWNKYITFKWMDETIHHLEKHCICIWFCPSSCRIWVVSQSSIYMTVTIFIGRSWTSMVDYAW
jgi:hypothetical protein